MTGNRETSRERAHDEERFRIALEAAPNAMIMIDGAGRIVFVSSQAEALFGYAKDEIIGQSVEILVPERFRLQHPEYRQAFFSSPQARPMGMGRDLYGRHKDGREIPVEIGLNPVTTEEGPFVIASIVDITERKRSEEALSSLAAIVEFSNDAIIGKTLDGVITSWNRGAERLYGYTAEEVIGQPISIIIPPEHPNELPEILEKIRRGDRVEHYETLRVRKDRRRLHISLTVSPIRNSNGETVGASAVARDITRRKQTEAALRAREEQLRIVTENAHVGLVMVDGGRRYNFANATYARILALPSPDIIGMRVPDVLAQLYEEQIRPHLDRAFAGERVASELRRPTPEGDHWYEVRYEPMRADGTVSLVVVVIVDVTERKQMEVALRNSEHKFSVLFSKASLPAVLSRLSDHAFVDVNDAWTSLFGYTREELIGKTALELGIHPDAEGLARLIEEVRQRKPVRNLEQKLFTKSGEARTVLLNINVITITGQDYALTYLQDITERKKLEDQLRQSQKMEAIGLLAGGVAHDFNNLLTAITGYSELALMKLREEDPLRHNLQEIKRASGRAASLTRQLLAFSRRQVLQPRVLDLNTIVSELEKMLQRLIGENIELSTSLEIGLGRVKADPGQIEQVIMNLVVNAKDAMPGGGKLMIETGNVYLDEDYARQHMTATPGPHVMLAVSDSGTGIDEATRARIFEPFFTTKEAGKGTGLGLSTVYGIVKQSGGNIWVYSEVGHGTTFKVYLPRVDKGAQEYKRAPEKRDELKGTETILLAEDEELVRKLTRDILETYGYKVLEAPNGGAALLICEQHEGKIHLLLSDVVMPEMSGRELSDRLAQLRPEMQVLYMSGYTDDAIVHQGVLEEGMNFIEKPFAPETLARKVREVLDKP